ncbi:MAG: prohibitin family protein [Endomicrobiales bacterium]|nr:prohibitin family protein [Endomicrobiales bacterium]
MDEFVLTKKIGSGLGMIVGISILCLLVLVKSVVIIPPGYVGVVIFFGKVRKQPINNGFHIINPLANVVKMSVRTEEYTMSVATAEGHIKGDDAIDALTKEGLNVRLDLTAWYKLLPQEAPRVYETIGPNYEKKIVRPALRTAIRDAVVKYTASGIYTEKRADVISDIESFLEGFTEDRGVVIEKILLRNVILPKRLMEAIDAKLAADQEAQKMEFVLLKEKKERERKVVEAEGIKSANQIIAAGLTNRYLQWYRIDMMKQLVNSPNNTIIFIPEDMKSPPIINIPSKNE